MASRIKGITVEIGGDTTGLDKALKSVNSSIKTTQSGLKDVSKLLKLDPTNTELLTQKQKLLKDAIGSTKEKLDALKLAQEQDSTTTATPMARVTALKTTEIISRIDFFSISFISLYHCVFAFLILEAVYIQYSTRASRLIIVAFCIEMCPFYRFFYLKSPSFY